MTQSGVKWITAGLFGVALGLFAVAWCIHDQTERHRRFEFTNRLWRIDTLKGTVVACDANGSEIRCEKAVELPP